MKNKQKKAEGAWLILIIIGLALVGWIATHPHG